MENSPGTTLIVIPARLGSTRLPEKLLLRETGKSVLQHTYEAASASTLANRVIVATDHPKIMEEIRHFHAEGMMTDPNAESGTDRVAEVAAVMNDYDMVVNVQGDEPEVDPCAIDLAITLLRDDPTAMMSTLAAPIRSVEQWRDPACVKVVTDDRGRAMYFSRSPIPYDRDGDGVVPAGARHHLGLYAYRRDFLLKFAELPPSRLEQLERLEQLRVLEAGYAIQIGMVAAARGGIDTMADYRDFVLRQNVRQAG